MDKKCRKHDPCGEVSLGTGREFDWSSMFIMDYPWGTDVQYKIEAIDLYINL